MISKFYVQHPWLYRKLRGLWWSVGRNLHKTRFLFTSNNLGFKINLIPTDDSVSKLIFLNSYEKETLSFFKKAIVPGDVVYDIGANIGFYSLYFSRLVGLNGQVHSFEPSAREFVALCENVSLNSIKNVYLNQLAISNETGYIDMAVLEDSAYGAYNTLGTPKHRNVINQSYHHEIVRTITLDKYFCLFESKLPTFIKIDVEGAEMLVLEGGANMFSRDNAPTIVIEVCQLTLDGFGIGSKDRKSVV